MTSFVSSARCRWHPLEGSLETWELWMGVFERSSVTSCWRFDSAGSGHFDWAGISLVSMETSSNLFHLNPMPLNSWFLDVRIGANRHQPGSFKKGSNLNMSFSRESRRPTAPSESDGLTLVGAKPVMVKLINAQTISAWSNKWSNHTLFLKLTSLWSLNAFFEPSDHELRPLRGRSRCSGCCPCPSIRIVSQFKHTGNDEGNFDFSIDIE